MGGRRHHEAMRCAPDGEAGFEVSSSRTTKVNQEPMNPKALTPGGVRRTRALTPDSPQVVR